MTICLINIITNPTLCNIRWMGIGLQLGGESKSEWVQDEEVT